MVSFNRKQLPEPGSSPRPKKSREKASFTDWFLPALILLATLAAYLPCSRNGFIEWDDRDSVYSNPDIRNLEGLGRIWITFDTPQYYPLVFTSYFFEYRFFGGENPGGYAMVNAVLHGLGAVLLFWVIRALGFRKFTAFLAAGLFALHPVQVASVAWIPERKNTLSALFYFASFLTYVGFLKKGGIVRYSGALFLFLLALCAKSVVVTLPIALLLGEYRIRGGWHRESLLRLIPFLVLGTILGVVTVYSEPRVELPGLWARLFLIAPRAVLFHLWKLLVPIGLSGMYPRWTVSPATIWDFIPLFGLVGLFAGIFFGRKKIGLFSTGGFLFFVITLSPMLGVIPFGYLNYSFVADHFAYLACAGIFLVLAEYFRRGISRWFPVLEVSEHRRPRSIRDAIPWVIPAGVLLLCGIGTFSRCFLYRDAVTFWNHVVEGNPGSPSAWMGMGVAYRYALEPRRALAAYREAVQLRPDWAEGHYHMGDVLLELEEIKAAIASFEKTVELDPGHARGQYNLGVALLRSPRGADREHAVSAFRRTSELVPRDPEVWFALAKALESMGRRQEAVEAMAEALRLAPGEYNPIWIRALLVFDQEAGKAREEAVRILTAFLETHPENYEVFLQIGVGLVNIGNTPLGTRFLEKGLREIPEHPLAGLAERKLNEARSGIVSGPSSSAVESPPSRD